AHQPSSEGLLEGLESRPSGSWPAEAETPTLSNEMSSYRDDFDSSSLGCDRVMLRPSCFSAVAVTTVVLAGKSNFPTRFQVWWWVSELRKPPIFTSQVFTTKQVGRYFFSSVM